MYDFPINNNLPKGSLFFIVYKYLQLLLMLLIIILKKLNIVRILQVDRYIVQKFLLDGKYIKKKTYIGILIKCISWKILTNKFSTSKI